MKILCLRIRKEECKEKCPLPLNLVPNMEKGIKEITYNEKTEKAEIRYDENLLSGNKVIEKLTGMGYHVKKC